MLRIMFLIRLAIMLGFTLWFARKFFQFRLWHTYPACLCGLTLIMIVLEIMRELVFWTTGTLLFQSIRMTMQKVEYTILGMFMQTVIFYATKRPQK
jgi:hypothetical protein